MRKRQKIGLAIFLIIIIGLVANEFILIPVSGVTSSLSCAAERVLFTNESSSSWNRGLYNTSDIILTGTALDSWWVTTDISKGHVQTYYRIDVDEVVKGSYNKDEIIVRHYGGCSYRWNYCVYVSTASALEKNEKYLLFLSQPYDDGSYGGFSGCDGSYWIDTDSSGNERVWCFADDINNCIEKEIDCPGSGESFGGYTEDGTPSMPTPCLDRHVLLEDLFNQIREA